MKKKKVKYACYFFQRTSSHRPTYPQTRPPAAPVVPVVQTMVAEAEPSQVPHVHGSLHWNNLHRNSSIPTLLYTFWLLKVHPYVKNLHLNWVKAGESFSSKRCLRCFLTGFMIIKTIIFILLGKISSHFLMAWLCCEETVHLESIHTISQVSHKNKIP